MPLTTRGEHLSQLIFMGTVYVALVAAVVSLWVAATTIDSLFFRPLCWLTGPRSLTLTLLGHRWGIEINLMERQLVKLVLHRVVQGCKLHFYGCHQLHILPSSSYINGIPQTHHMFRLLLDNYNYNNVCYPKHSHTIETTSWKGAENLFLWTAIHHITLEPCFSLLLDNKIGFTF